MATPIAERIHNLTTEFTFLTPEQARKLCLPSAVLAELVEAREAGAIRSDFPIKEIVNALSSDPEWREIYSRVRAAHDHKAINV